MELKKLGNSYSKVSSYCLGMIIFGESTDEIDTHQQINDSIFAGTKFIYLI